MFRFTDPDKKSFSSGVVKRNTFHQIPTEDLDPIGLVPVLTTETKIKFGSLGDCESLTPALTKIHKLYCCDFNDVLTRLDSLTGDKEWDTGLSGNFAYDVAVDSDGNVYAVSGNYLYKYDKDGNEQWSYNWDDQEAVAVSKDGTLFAVYSGYFGTVRILDQDRNEVWTGAGTRGNLRIDADKNIYTDIGHKIDSQGNEIWNYDVYDTCFVVNPYDVAVDKSGNVYYAIYNGYVEKVDSGGSQVWLKQFTPSGSAESATSIGVNPDDDSYVYVGFQSGYIAKIDASDGSELWSYHCPNIDTYDVRGIAVDSQENVYAGGYTSVEALDKDKNTLWSWNNATGEVRSVEVDP